MKTALVVRKIHKNNNFHRETQHMANMAEGQGHTSVGQVQVHVYQFDNTGKYRENTGKIPGKYRENTGEKALKKGKCAVCQSAIIRGISR